MLIQSPMLLRLRYGVNRLVVRRSVRGTLRGDQADTGASIVGRALRLVPRHTKCGDR